MNEKYRADVQNAVYAYEEEETNAVDGVSFKAEKGELIAVLGHNGSGKSTLAKLLNALYLPNQGKVLICGLDTQDEKETWNIRQHAGMVFQNPDNQLVATVVREDVAFGLENLGVPTEEMIPRIDAALKAVRMTEFAESAPHLLSGGQKQRVAIAGVLAMEPDVLIADEATAMLDPTGRKEVLETVMKLNKEKGITVLWITHFMEEAALCDRVIVMSEGKIVTQGTPREVFRNVEDLKKLHLDVPPMAELCQQLNAGGMRLPEGILTVEEMAKEVALKLCPSKSKA
ncbi:MAG: energy-coupling factor transporter ATPase [Clostridia bacterium]|nr:energy-coupling factor transporter ATPase [Clostridia bacterium]